MNYQQRTTMVSEALAEYLAPLAPPRALDEDGQAEIVRRMIKAIVSRLPVGNEEIVRGAIERMLDGVTRSHKGWAWPAPEEFVAAIPGGGGGGRRAQETFRPDRSAEAMAGKMARGEAVPEAAVWRGVNGVPPSVLSNYRSGSAHALAEVYGADGARAYLRRRYGDVAATYFPEAAE